MTAAVSQTAAATALQRAATELTAVTEIPEVTEAAADVVFHSTVFRPCFLLIFIHNHTEIPSAAVNVASSVCRYCTET